MVGLYRVPSLLIEGRLLETILKAERGVASRGCGSLPLSREARDPARQALRPGCEELAARIRRQCRRWKRGTWPKTATVERREARVPPALRDAGTPLGARPAASCAGQPVPLHRCACRRSAHPSLGVVSRKPRALTRRGNEKCCSNGLFDELG